jgi:hypothetical protein
MIWKKQPNNLEAINRKNLSRGWVKDALRGTFTILLGLSLSIFTAAPARASFWPTAQMLEEEPLSQQETYRLRCLRIAHARAGASYYGATGDVTDEEVIDAIRSVPEHFAISGQTVWEVRPSTGSDNNGGFFVAGATGTDWSQQGAAQLNFDGTVVAAHTAGVTSTIILTGYTPQNSDVGNAFNITGGTGFITGIYQIVSINIGGLTWTLDRNATSGVASGATGNMGGAIKTLATLASNMVASNKAFVKSEATITTTTGFVFSTSSITVGPTVPATTLFGYTSSRGDHGLVSVSFSTATSTAAMGFSGNGWRIDGWSINCNSTSGSDGINIAGSCDIRNCKVSNFDNSGVTASATGCSILYCEFTGGTANGVASIQFTSLTCIVARCNIHDNACPGIVFSNSSSSSAIRENVFSNNSGSSSDAIQITGGNNVVCNSIYKSGRHGVLFTSGGRFQFLFIKNNSITDHTAVGAAGIKCATAALPADPRWDGNFFYNNTSNRVNLDDTSTNAIDGVNPYVNQFDVQLTASPWTDAAGNDFTLNNTAGGGAAVRAACGPKGGTVYSGIPGLTQSGYLDGGVFQHQDPAVGDEGVVIFPQMTQW